MATCNTQSEADVTNNACDIETKFFVGDECTDGSDEPKTVDSCEEKQVIVGICAMEKKSQSRPMLEILERLRRFEYIRTVVFEEQVILTKPIEEWPVCDCLISFHSKGFPLDKAVKYAELREPMVINDLYMQYSIMDRKKVHEILQEHGIAQPRYAALDRSAGNQNIDFVETEDSIEVNGVVFQKPFVEKPINADDHNVYIYFPVSAGGGSQRLFRKIANKSSVYSSINTVRKMGSYIYEDFMPTDGTDVKVYTVGPDYAHAEARKSPALDGKVERDKDGKEIRYPVLLSAKEKLVARKVYMAFKQTVCGFDLLRANGKSYVCDVNGFSFVKTSPKYYDDCAKILGNMILRQLAPSHHIPYSITYQPEDIPIVPTTYGTMMELRCVIAVIRHGDRTPKQKMKMEVRHKKFFELFEKYNGYKSGQLKLKRPKQLQEVLDIARALLMEKHNKRSDEFEEKRSKLKQLKAVLEMYGHFSGINRKVQLKYQPHGAPRRSSDDDDDGPRDPSLVLILKWGGELTPAGKIQAEELGKAFRCMYPGGQGDYGAPGLGLLRLHSTQRHDLKIYASDEGRVQMTAAAFARGFLALEGELTPILVQMVKSANMNGLLDNDNESSKYQNIVKERLQTLLNLDRDFTEEDYEKLVPTGGGSLIRAMRTIGNPLRACNRIYYIMCKLLDRIKELKQKPRAEEVKLYHGESWELMTRRWSKLVKDFRMKNKQYDISKVPDIYDCIKYDLLHNNKILRFKESNELHVLSKAMADIVIPQEYGVTKEEKLLIGQCICMPLLRKILVDLQRNVDEDTTRLDSRYSEGVSTPHRHVRTRLYFTSESHIHSLLTIFRYGGLLDPNKDQQWARAMEYVNGVPELNYMTQIVIMMYEDPTKDPASDERFHVELHFSPGAYTVGQDMKDPAGPGFKSQMKEHEKKLKEAKEKELAEKAKIHDHTFPESLTDIQSQEVKVMDKSQEDTSTSLSSVSSIVTLSDSSSFQSKDSTSETRLSSNSLEKVASLPEFGIGTGEENVNPILPLMIPEVMTNETRSDATTPSNSTTSDTLQDQISIEDSRPTPDEVKSVTFDPLPHVSDTTSPGIKQEQPLPCTASPEEAHLEQQQASSAITEPVNITTKSRQRHKSAGSLGQNPNKFSQQYVSEESLKEAMDFFNPNKERKCYDDNERNVADLSSKSLKKDGRRHSYENDLHKREDLSQIAIKAWSDKALSSTAEQIRSSFLSMFAQSHFDKSGAHLPLLISTQVITGSASAPDLTTDDCLRGVEGWKVPSIRPLETLHNALTLKQMETFMRAITETAFRTPVSSPCQGTPICLTPRGAAPPMGMLNLSYYPGYSSGCSSSGPSSPTSMSNPDVFMRKLKQLMNPNSNSSETDSASQLPSQESRSSDSSDKMTSS
ncbi:hypothetical protein LSH36_446g00009 [Paralvinella palmiformis]|uniref:Inositol hexakisphosphate and diphosphoinositol-pentakisphosphate kinase n=1 Tax=Paralvinella palmiformis TaxID=53620 RepID=A0AAD9JB32_9ANNE|nr:hypothetical protein LSH36_446g00009 [Paralvinella palmiformis]